MDWKDISGAVGKVAPILGTLLGGPAGGAVGALVASALGTANDADSVSAAMAGNPEAAVKLREIETNRAIRLQELAVQAAVTELQTAAADRADARKMQVSSHSPVPALLSISVTLGYFGILVGMMVGSLKVSDSQALLLMLGSLSTAWGAVMAFWFGTTRDSGEKTRLLAQSQPVK